MIPERGEAINYAIDMAQGGDAVLILGKGHETTMTIGKEEFPWSDRETARTALLRKLKK